MNYRKRHTKTVLEPITEDGGALRVQVADRLTIDIREIQLIEYPDGTCRTWVYGSHVRLDGQRGAHNRGCGWDLGQPMPAAIAEIVEHAKPSWGAIPRA